MPFYDRGRLFITVSQYIATCGLLTLLLGCQDTVDEASKYTPPAKVTLQNIAITSQQIRFAMGSQSRLAAIGFYSDGTSEDITETAQWQSDNLAIVEFNAANSVASKRGLVAMKDVGTY